METSGGIRASLAGRYASALFDLARDERQIDAVSQSLDRLKAGLGESRELQALVSSPLVSRDAAGKALDAVAPSLGLDPLTLFFCLLGLFRVESLEHVLAAFFDLHLAVETVSETSKSHGSIMVGVVFVDFVHDAGRVYGAGVHSTSVAGHGLASEL